MTGIRKNCKTKLLKYLLTILSFIIALCTYAQQRKPIGVANTYTLTEADGFPGFNYTYSFIYSPSGKIYTKDFFGTFHITGNNFIKKIDSLKMLSNGAHIFIKEENEVWLTDYGNKIYILKNDSIQKTIQNINGTKLNARLGNRFFSIRPAGKKLQIFELIREQWVLRNADAWDTAYTVNFAVISNQKNIICVKEGNKKAIVCRFDTLQYRLIPQKTIRLDSLNYYYFIAGNEKKEKALTQAFENFYKTRTGKPFTNKTFAYTFNGGAFTFDNDFNWVTMDYGNSLLYEFANYDSTGIKPNTILFETKEKPNRCIQNPYYPYITVLTGNKPFRVFPYIKKYPHVYNNDHSQNIFMLSQDDAGRIWAGSYQHYLSVIEAPSVVSTSLNHQGRNHQRRGKKLPSPSEEGQGVKRLLNLGKQPTPFMNAALNYNGKMYFVGESYNGGVLQYDMQGRMRKLQPQLSTGFYLYYAPLGKKIYYPAADEYYLYVCAATELEKSYVRWEKLGTTQGIAPYGMTTLTEDKLGRIWMGHPKKGFTVYNPQIKKGVSYSTAKNETPIGFISSLTDNKGTVFMGSDEKGLWYYKDYTKPPTPQNIHRLSHPLLNSVKRITAMTVYNNWLVLGCYNRVCLVNLDSFYLKNKAVVRYLNPQEAAFTSFTEQNTMLTSKTDSSIWFSTSDMLYQWDIKTWLQLPFYKVNVNTFLLHDSARIALANHQPLDLKASINSFDIVFEYLSPDCLPRYTRTAFVKDKDSIIFTEPDQQSQFSYKNLSSGNYVFYLEIFEQDGSISQYKYEFYINKFIWQKWWFWVLASFLFLMPFLLWLNALRKRAVQQKEISQLNIITLSSQFRPHFILNALNTIGADLYKKPAAETVISRLGESVNLIFNHARQKNIAHSLTNEWVLVKNVIDIHRIMYIPDLELQLPPEDWLKKYADKQIPMGILEIMVENALLHGLRNKKEGPYLLTIIAKEDASNIYFEITDNGIGRGNAIQLSSYKRHGTGTKNLTEIIDILNKFNTEKITIEYADSNINKNNTGTRVIITLPKNYHYEY